MPAGLTQQEAEKLLQTHGYNEITEQKKVSAFTILLRQIQGNFVLYLLIFSVVLSLFIGKTVTAYVILFVIALVIIVGFILEYKAERAIETLKKMVTELATVIRDGKEQEIPAKELVPGDVVILKSGSRVPADIEITESHNLRINESILTGESQDVEKNARNESEDLTEEQTAYMGTFIVEGNCVGQVVHTGMETKFGRIAQLINTAEKEMPLQKKINNITRYMIIVSLTFSALTGLVMALRSDTLDSTMLAEILMVVVALSVSAVPEGLPVVLITTLANGALRMAKQNALVNRMSVIGTVGETTVICSDKTGTITKGEMTVKKIYWNDNVYDVTGSGYSSNGKIGLPDDSAQNEYFQLLLKTAIVTNDARIVQTDDAHNYTISGTPTEAALLILGKKAQKSIEDYDFSRAEEIPFSSSRKMMSVWGSDGNVYAKGAPEALLAKCTHAFLNNKVVELDSVEHEKINTAMHTLATQAYRTLACAYKPHSGAEKYDENNLIFLGLVGIEDPPREEVAAAIATALHAQIQVKMITGDSLATAKAIAAQIGLIGEAIEGKELDSLNDTQLAEKVKDIVVFARVRPEHKVRIVKALKRNKELVAMTGDGVNDAPALKEAHVGIAMGITGTDVSRSVADITLKDDNFATIVSAIKEGRSIFQNIQTFVSYQLSINMAQLFIIFIGVLIGPFLGWQIPLFIALQILFVNIITDSVPAIALGLIPAREDIMNRGPVKSGILTKNLIAFIIGAGVVTGTIVLSIFFLFHDFFGLQHEEARSLAFFCFILIAVVNAFNFLSLRTSLLSVLRKENTYIFVAAGISLLASAIVFYTPLRSYFELIPLSAKDWGIAFASVAAVTVLFEITKFIHRKRII